MKHQMLKNAWIVALTLWMVLPACNKDQSFSEDDVENYIDEVVFDMQRQGNCGKFGCYEFVFPITISFSDGTSTEVADHEQLRSILREYREENPEGEKPVLGFPLEVMTEDGEVLSVASQEELHDLRVQCRREFFLKHHHQGHRFRGMFCFKLDYPVSVQLPDGTIVEVSDRIDLQYTLRRWKADHPDSDERPELVFPLTVIMEDGTEVTVDSADALKELKESCSR